MRPTDQHPLRAVWTPPARLAWVLAGLAGLVGALAFIHTEGYFVTFMTGNTERAVLGWFHGDQEVAISAALIWFSFIGGVILGSMYRRRYGRDHPHGVTVLTTLLLAMASALDVFEFDAESKLPIGPVLLVAAAIGALNTSFVRDGEVSVPLSYMTGTTVKLGQAIERHASGKGTAAEWLSYLILLASFACGALIGGIISRLVPGSAMLMTATIVSGLVTGYTYLHEYRHGPLPE